MVFRRQPIKLQDCKQHGPDSGAELFIVEGDSASSSVAGVRNPENQAVLPMQGKPMNALKASTDRVHANKLFGALITALGCGAGNTFNADELRYQRILLLFDPDADGIHSGALMLMFFHRFMPALLENDSIHMVRAPLFRVTSPRLAAPAYAGSPAHYEHIVKQLTDKNVGDFQTLRYRGLGSLEKPLLIDRCVDPQTRSSDIMRASDAQMAMQVFASRDEDRRRD